MPEHDPEKERAVFEEEANRLISGSTPRLMKMTREGEEFYFDTTDLSIDITNDNVSKFTEMRAQGWQIDAKGIALPAFLPARQQAIKSEGFISSDWGYKKVNSLP